MRNRKAPLIYQLLGTLLGIGYFPLAPATCASLIVCIVLWFLFTTPVTYIISIAILFALGVWIAFKLEPFWGEDNRRIVIDESIGMIITLFAVPQKFLYYAVGFFLFRFFDIVKPFPIGDSQKLKGGWGVVIDDVIAGMYSSIALWIFIYIFYRIA